MLYILIRFFSKLIVATCTVRARKLFLSILVDDFTLLPLFSLCNYIFMLTIFFTAKNVNIIKMHGANGF